MVREERGNGNILFFEPTSVRQEKPVACFVLRIDEHLNMTDPIGVDLAMTEEMEPHRQGTNNLMANCNQEPATAQLARLLASASVV